MLHALLSSLKVYNRTALPYMLWEIQNFHVNQDFPRSRKANSFRTTSTQKTKQRRWGNFTQEPLQLQSNKKCKILLEELASSDPKLALTGVPIVQWPKRDKLKFPTRPKVRVPTIPITKPHTMKPAPRLTPVRPAAASPIVSGARRRRVRCRKCKACVQGECGVCHYCRDMKKFGGPGRMKQSCVLRQCLAPRLPHSVTCSLCGEVDQNEETQDFEKKTHGMLHLQRNSSSWLPPDGWRGVA